MTNAANVEYLTLNVGGNPVVIILSEHPIITYTDNTLHIQTEKESVEVPVNQISGAVFSETTGINNILIEEPQITRGQIRFKSLPYGSQISIYNANGTKISTMIAGNNGQTIVDISNLPIGVYFIKFATQTIKITNK